MNDSQIIALFWERNEDAIRETDAVMAESCMQFPIRSCVLSRMQKKV